MVHIKMNTIKIDEISNSSGVFSGNNMQLKWKAAAISNEGFGELSGNGNRTSNQKSLVVNGTCKEEKDD